MHTVERFTITTDSYQTISSTTGEFLAIGKDSGDVLSAWLRKDSEKTPANVEIFCIEAGDLLPEGAIRHIGTHTTEEGTYLFFTSTKINKSLNFNFRVNGCRCPATCECSGE